MGLLDKVKSAAETAATKAKEGVEDVQAKRELGQAYGDLGKVTFELVDSGEIANSRFDDLVAKIRELNQSLADEAESAEASGATEGAEAVSPDNPA